MGGSYLLIYPLTAELPEEYNLYETRSKSPRIKGILTGEGGARSGGNAGPGLPSPPDQFRGMSL